MAKKNKENYALEMEAYKQKKDEEAANLMKEEEEHMKLQKQEALQLLKKKEKTEIIIKVFALFHLVSFLVDFQLPLWLIHLSILQKTKQKKKQNKEDKISDPNRPKRPPSSFLIFRNEARKSLQEERPGVSNPTLNALVSLKWKVL